MDLLFQHKHCSIYMKHIATRTFSYSIVFGHVTLSSEFLRTNSFSKVVYKYLTTIWSIQVRISIPVDQISSLLNYIKAS
jgi:hypothetical protein